jgi:flavin reductase (DIM6/NTAB) family NADH-FMN oxidoreductase RutF
VVSPPGVPPDRFRDLLGRFATGVTVLTTLAPDGRPLGMTASAVAAVSLEPPLVLVCVDRTRDMHEALRAAPRFVLNVLAEDQEALSRRFADEVSDRFAGVAVRAGPHGLPLLPDAAAYIVCEAREAIPAGDHTIFIGLVAGGAAHERPPLIHYRGDYGGLGERRGDGGAYG